MWTHARQPSPRPTTTVWPARRRAGFITTARPQRHVSMNSAPWGATGLIGLTTDRPHARSSSKELSWQAQVASSTKTAWREAAATIHVRRRCKPAAPAPAQLRQHPCFRLVVAAWIAPQAAPFARMARSAPTWAPRGLAQLRQPWGKYASEPTPVRATLSVFPVAAALWEPARFFRRRDRHAIPASLGAI
jgi:hypothetical protein